MATTRKEIELRITANDLGTQALEKLEQTLVDLGAAQEKYAKSGDVASRSLRDLKQDVADLQRLGQTVAGRGALIDDFIGTRDRLQAAKQRLTEIRATFEQFGQTIEGVKRKTAEQRETQARLTRELSAAEKQVKSLEGALGKTGEKLKAIGVTDVDRAAQAYVGFADKIGQSLKRAETSVREYDTALKAQNQTTAKTVDAQRQLEQANRELQASGEKLKGVIAFRGLGEEALDASRKVNALDRDFDQLAAAAVKGGDGIRSIIDPTKQAITSLDGLEREVTALNAKLTKAEGSEKLRTELRGLRTEYLKFAADAGKAAAQLADDIGDYRKQADAVRKLRTELEGAQATVTRYGTAVANAAEQDDALLRSLRESQAIFERLNAQYAREAQSLANRGAALRQAGVDTANLSAAEARLLAVANGVTATNDKLGASFRQVGTGAQTAGKQLSFFEEQGRKALSIQQRIRGQILSLTASYVGLFGAIQAVQNIFTAGQRNQNLQIRLDVANEGDIRKTALDLAFTRKLADELGFSFLDLSEAYSKFKVAAVGAGTSAAEVRSIFTSFAKVSRAFNTSQEETNGIFRALEQILSKGKVQAEELRGQLGDRLSGAFNTFAASLGISTKQLDKLIEDGKVPSELLLLFAQEYEKKVAGSMPKATKTLSAEVGRLGTAIDDALIAISGGEFEKELSGLIADITKFLTSDEGANFAKNLRAAFGTLFSVLRQVIENFDVLMALFKAFVLLKIASLVLDLAGALVKAGIAASSAAVGVSAFGAAIRLAGGLVVAFFIALSTFPEFAEIVNQTLQKAFTYIEFAVNAFPVAFKALWAGVKGVSFAAMRGLVTAIDDFLNGIHDKVIDGAVSLFRFAGVTISDAAVNAIKARNASFGAAVKDWFQEGITAASAAIDGYKKEIARLEELRDLTLSSITGASPGAKDTSQQDALAEQQRVDKEILDRRIAELKNTVAKLLAEADKGKDKLANQSEALAKSIADDLTRFQSEILESQEQSLDKQFEAINQKFSLIRKKINDLQKGQTIDLGDGQVLDRLGALTVVENYEDILKLKAREQYFNDQLEKQQKTLNESIAQRAALIENARAEAEANGTSEEEQAKRIIEINNQFAEGIRSQAQAVIEFLSNLPEDVFTRLGADVLIAQLRTVQTELGRAQSYTEQLGRSFSTQIAQGATDTLLKFGEGIGKIVDGTGSLGDAFKNAMSLFRSFAADFLINIARMIIQAQILKAIQASGAGGFFSNLIGAASAHAGGVVGNSGIKRNVPSWVFAAAQRFHGGGLPGLQAREIPTILKEGEEVLSQNNPRNILNGGAAANGGSSGGGVKIVNAIDAGSFVSEGLSSKEGQQSVLNFIRANKSAVRNAIN